MERDITCLPQRKADMLEWFMFWHYMSISRHPLFIVYVIFLFVHFWSLSLIGLSFSICIVEIENLHCSCFGFHISHMLGCSHCM